MIKKIAANLSVDPKKLNKLFCKQKFFFANFS